jgi:hypothetical protein
VIGLFSEYLMPRPSTKRNLRLYDEEFRITEERIMAANMALKRARKAQKRKQIVAEKRRTEALEAGLPARVLRAAHAPIQECLLTESLFDTGIGSLVLTRGVTSYNVALSGFLIDVFCLGIKDVTLRHETAA